MYILRAWCWHSRWDDKLLQTLRFVVAKPQVPDRQSNDIGIGITCDIGHFELAKPQVKMAAPWGLGSSITTTLALLGFSQG